MQPENPTDLSIQAESVRIEINAQSVEGAGVSAAGNATTASDASGDAAGGFKMPENFDEASDWIGQALDMLVDQAVIWVPRIAVVIILLIVALIVAGWAKRASLKALRRARLDETLARFLSSTLRYGIIILFVLGCLGMFGFEMTSFAAVIGASALAIGLAFQGSLSSLAAGIMLLIFRPFKVGSVVQIADVTGKIDEIGIFQTTLDTFDNKRFIIPNSEIFGSVIENITYHPVRRVDVPVGAEYSANIDATRAALEQAALSVEGRIDEPAHQIFLDGLGDSSVNWIVRLWCNTPEWVDVKQRTVQAVKEHLDGAGIGIPFPQMDVHLDRTDSQDSDKPAG